MRSLLEQLQLTAAVLAPTSISFRIDFQKIGNLRFVRAPKLGDEQPVRELLALRGGEEFDKARQHEERRRSGNQVELPEPLNGSEEQVGRGDRILGMLRLNDRLRDFNPGV